MHIGGVMMQNGKEVDVNTLEDYLGAKAHMVVVSLTDKKYLHVHRLRRVYVWELPVRFYHWLNAGVIVVLVTTGFLIGSPPALISNDEATHRFWLGKVRFIHFIAAYIFFFNLFVR